MGTNLLLTLAAAVIVALCAPATALAQAPTEDSVVGTLQTPDPPSAATRYVIDARSGPSGENPRGTVHFELALGGVVVFSSTLSVSCLDVSGVRAVIVAAVSPGIHTFAVHVVVVDSPPGEPDRLAGTTFFDAGIPDCVPAVSGDPVPAGGSVTITDAQPFATSKEQCKRGGYAMYGFRNQGQCVAFVTRGA